MDRRLINILLISIAAIMLLTWTFSGSITGHVSYSLDSSEPYCKFVTMDLCCFEVQKMLKCEVTSNDLDYTCYNLKEGNKYYLNSKAFNYCLKEGYDVKKAN